MGDGRRETNERREVKSSRNEVHDANAVVWEPVRTRTRLVQIREDAPLRDELVRFPRERERGGASRPRVPDHDRRPLRLVQLRVSGHGLVRLLLDESRRRAHEQRAAAPLRVKR
eukprot:30827-Pelagococcus_subviridis.AAC.7